MSIVDHTHESTGAQGGQYLKGLISIGIGTTSPAEKLHVEKLGNVTTTGLGRFLQPEMTTAGQEVNIAIGKALSAGGCGLFGYRYAPSGDETAYIAVYGDTAALNVRKGGKVGIGTTSPSVMLEIGGTSNRGSAKIIGNDDYGLVLQSGGGGAGSGAVIDFYDADTSYAARLKAYKTASNTADLVFMTANAGAPTERLRIKSDGKVGIGETGPDASLVIVGSSSDTLRLRNTAGANEYYKIGRNTSTGYLDFTGTQTDYIGYTFNGKVGIGTTNPGLPLDIQASPAAQRIKSTGSNSAWLIIDSGSGQDAIIEFYDGGTWKWNAGKDSSNNFIIQRYVASDPAFRILTDDTVRLGTTNYWDINPSTGDLVPSGDKTHMIGSATKRVERIYTDGTVSGCGRYIKTRTPCSKCGEPTYRSTPSPTIGEGFDFGMVFCNSCGAVSVEKFNHLPKEKLSSIRPAPSIYLKKLKVTGTGHTRIVTIMYEYKDDEGNTWNNTTHFGDDELDNFLKMGDADKKAFLRKIGEREWQSLEETRIMGEYSKELESKLDSFNLAGVCLNHE